MILALVFYAGLVIGAVIGIILVALCRSAAVADSIIIRARGRDDED